MKIPLNHEIHEIHEIHEKMFFALLREKQFKAPSRWEGE
jgi:hypothetical protein